MKKPILRLFVITLLLALLIGAIVSIVGWLLGWDTSVQFSNGLFISGALIIVAGVFSVAGGYNMRADPKLTYAQSAGNMNLEQRTHRLVSDMRQEYHASIFLSLTGAFLIGMAILVGNFFIGKRKFTLWRSPFEREQFHVLNYL
jgi:hypothetical protein